MLQHIHTRLHQFGLSPAKLALILIAVVFSILLELRMAETPYLYQVDSWTHRYFTERTETQSILLRHIETANGNTFAPYDSIMRTNIALLSSFSGIDVYTFYRFGSIVLRLLYILVLYMALTAFTRYEGLALMVAVISFSSWYYSWRSHLMFPENSVLLYNILIIWSFKRLIDTRDKGYSALVAVCFVAVMYTHTRSLYYTAIIYAGFVLHMFVHYQWYNLRLIVLHHTVAIVFVFPILLENASILRQVVAYNFGDQSTYGSIVAESPRYAPPDFDFYLRHMGYLLLPMGIASALIIIVAGIKEHLHVFTMLLLGFILSLGPRLQLYVPPDRMQAYLYIPITIGIVSAMTIIFDKSLNRVGQFFVISGFIAWSLINTYLTDPWFALWRGEFPASEHLNTLLADDPDAYVGLIDDTMRAFFLMDHPEQICLIDVTDQAFIANVETPQPDVCVEPEFYLSRAIDNHPPGYQLLQEHNQYYLFVSEAHTPIAADS